MDEEIAVAFGSFMDAVPHWAFIIIHSALIVVAYALSRRTKNNGFLLFVLAELSYITYHAGLTHFLFAHLIAEVLDVLALTLIAVGFSKRLVTGIAPVIPGAAQHR